MNADGPTDGNGLSSAGRESLGSFPPIEAALERPGRSGPSWRSDYGAPAGGIALAADELTGSCPVTPLRGRPAPQRWRLSGDDLVPAREVSTVGPCKSNAAANATGRGPRTEADVIHQQSVTVRHEIGRSNGE